MLVFDLHFAMAALDEFRDQVHRARAIQRDERRDVLDGTDLKFAAQIAHVRLAEIAGEDALAARQRADGVEAGDAIADQRRRERLATPTGIAAWLEN